MATLAVQTLGVDGTTPTLVAATSGAGGDIFFNTGNEVVVVNNGGGAPITVTFAAVKLCDTGQVAHNKTWSVPNGAQEMIAAPPGAWFNDDNGFTKMTYSSVTSVTVGVIKR